MIVKQDDLWLCEECMIAAVNGDFSSIDSDEQVRNIEYGLKELGPGLVHDFDSETQDGIYEFTLKLCACCKTYLAGSRYRFAVLGADDASD